MNAVFLVIAVLAAPVAGMIAYDRIVIGPVEAVVERDFTPVIAALDAYQAAKGRYPEKLDGLVPAYMKKLPACPRIESRLPMTGDTSYNPAPGGSAYTLGCFVGIMVFPQDAMYFSETKTWGRLD